MALRRRATSFHRGFTLLKEGLSGVGMTGVCGGGNEPSCTSGADSSVVLTEGGLWYVFICSSMLQSSSSLYAGLNSRSSAGGCGLGRPREGIFLTQTSFCKHNEIGGHATVDPVSPMVMGVYDALSTHVSWNPLFTASYESHLLP